jgi:hypothetical protein
VTLPRIIMRGMTSAHDRDTPAGADMRARKAADQSASKSRRECMLIGGWGASTQRLKEQNGDLHRFLIGSSVRVTTDSLYDHLIALANATPRQGRKPSGTSFQKKKRQPTPAELDGLKRANAARHEEKVRKRGEAQGSRV